MSSPLRDLTIVFNGEIYNYRELRKLLHDKGHFFQSDSDTEVLLAAWSQWGHLALPKLLGMYAFAILDARRSTLTLVRDGFGVKPLFWSLDGGSFTFASEIQALLDLNESASSPNSGVLTNYLLTGSYEVGSETFFKGVNRLETGHLLTIDLEQPELQPEIRKWWAPETRQSGGKSLDESAEIIRGLFLESVSLHLRSDVPLGFALSGGIDSSAVVSAVRYLEPEMPLETFSYVAPGAEVDEEKWIDLVNVRVGARSHKVELGPANLAEDLDDMIRCQGEPFGGTSIYAQYAVYRKARESGVTVTLDGQGADELFAGYHGYVEKRILSLLDEWRVLSALGLLGRWSKWPGRNPIRAIKAVVGSLVPREMWPKIRAGMRGASCGVEPGWLSQTAGDYVSPQLLVNTEERGRKLVGMLRSELTGGGLEKLLRHGDRNSMRWSVESRVPFLTIPLAEAALGLREDHLLSPSGETKSVLRRALRGIVPDQILDRRDKIGFQTPETGWLLALAPQIQNSWLDGLDALPMVNADRVRSDIIGQLETGRIAPGTWRFLNASRWAMQFL